MNISNPKYQGNITQAILNDPTYKNLTAFYGKNLEKNGDREGLTYHWPNLSHPGLASASPPIIMKAGPPSYFWFSVK